MPTNGIAGTWKYGGHNPKDKHQKSILGVRPIQNNLLTSRSHKSTIEIHPSDQIPTTINVQPLKKNAKESHVIIPMLEASRSVTIEIPSNRIEPPQDVNDPELGK